MGLEVVADEGQRVVDPADGLVARRVTDHLGRRPRAGGLGLPGVDEGAAPHRGHALVGIALGRRIAPTRRVRRHRCRRRRTRCRPRRPGRAREGQRGRATSGAGCVQSCSPPGCREHVRRRVQDRSAWTPWGGCRGSHLRSATDATGAATADGGGVNTNRLLRRALTLLTVTAALALLSPTPASAATGAATVFTNPNVNGPQLIAAGPDGNLWFTNPGNNRIGRITPAGAITTFVDPEGEVENPYAIAPGPDGDMWFTSTTDDRIAEIDTVSGQITTYDLPLGSGSTGITAGPDGDVWFTTLNGFVGEIDPTTGVVAEYAVDGIQNPERHRGGVGRPRLVRQRRRPARRDRPGGPRSRVDHRLPREPHGRRRRHQRAHAGPARRPLVRGPGQRPGGPLRSRHERLRDLRRPPGSDRRPHRHRPGRRRQPLGAEQQQPRRRPDPSGDPQRRRPLRPGPRRRGPDRHRGRRRRQPLGDRLRRQRDRPGEPGPL